MYIVYLFCLIDLFHSFIDNTIIPWHIWFLAHFRIFFSQNKFLIPCTKFQDHKLHTTGQSFLICLILALSTVDLLFYDYTVRSFIRSSTFPCSVMKWCECWEISTKHSPAVRTYTWSSSVAWSEKSVSRDIQVCWCTSQWCRKLEIHLHIKEY